MNQRASAAVGVVEQCGRVFMSWSDHRRYVVRLLTLMGYSWLVPLACGGEMLDAGHNQPAAGSSGAAGTSGMPSTGTPV